nr:unnamed protein product [Haemonchus contortus]
MKLRCAILVVSFLCLATAQGCKYIRYETAAEAERRAIFERCLLLGCETDCALQEDFELFAACRQRCTQKRRTLKKLRGFKKLHDQ